MEATGTDVAIDYWSSNSPKQVTHAFRNATDEWVTDRFGDAAGDAARLATVPLGAVARMTTGRSKWSNPSVRSLWYRRWRALSCHACVQPSTDSAQDSNLGHGLRVTSRPPKGPQDAKTKHQTFSFLWSHSLHPLARPRVLLNVAAA
ncbi:MAG: hypothetical protein AAFZ38_03795 [Myxococcota bacterium]